MIPPFNKSLRTRIQSSNPYPSFLASEMIYVAMEKWYWTNYPEQLTISPATLRQLMHRINDRMTDFRAYHKRTTRGAKRRNREDADS